MRARSTIVSGANPPRCAGGLGLALVALTCASVAFALVPGRPLTAASAADPSGATLEPDRSSAPVGARASDRALAETAEGAEEEETSQDESDEGRSDAELDALAWGGTTHDWLPAWAVARVDVLHVHAPPAHAHVEALERPPRVG